MIGETISHYRIIEQLGAGGMGVVYLAEDTTLGRRVAIKFLSSTTREYRARFLREARAVSALSHPNIATVFDYGETSGGQPYIVMELIRGRPLNEKLEEGSLPLAETVRIVSCIAEALGEAHHQGVVHRDVKPSNVVIAERGQVKVLDFGLVKQLYEQYGMDGDPNQATLPATHTRSDVIVGTPLYLSPEQATGKKVDGRSDLFALGAVLYECLTGHSAFAGSSLLEIGAQVIHVTPPVPSQLNDRVPAELDRITMKAMEKKVEARYQSADEMIKDLRLVLPGVQEDGFGTGARSTKPLSTRRTHSASALTTISETFRRPRLSLGTFVLAIFALALAGWAVVRWGKPSPYKPSAVALDWYTKGTDALRNGAFLQASKALEQAVATDNKFALAHARLADAWTELDYEDKAKDEMLKVQSLVPNRSQLAASDALHLEAINATLTKDFGSAIKAYTELARLSPNEPQVYVDLGRAYEKNDDLKKAIESYVEATNRSPQYATAFLRVGILYGRQLDLASASAAFDKADALYQALGNFEGQAEVSFQRGYLFDQIGKVGEARQPLQRAFELARTTANEYQQVKTLLKLGDVELDANDLPEARKYMHQAVDLAQAKSIDNLTKRGLVDLGNTFVVEGNYPEAEKYFTQSLELAQKQKDRRNAARALLSLGSLAERGSNGDQAVSYIEQALPFYQEGGYSKETSQAFALLARVEVQKGDYDVALKAFEQELKLAQQLGDQAQAALAQEDIGLLFIRQGRYPEALGHFQESYGIAKSLGSQKNIGLSLIDRANALWRLGRYDEARAALSEASAIAERSDAAKTLLAYYYLAIARMALTEHRFLEAQANSQQAVAVAGTQVKDAAIAARFTLGLAQALSGSSRQGQLKCQEAVEMARQSGDPSFLSEALLSLAEVMVQNGDATGALKNSLESQEVFARSGKHDYEWRAWLIAARASKSGGDSQKAHEYASRAESLLSGLQQKWGGDNYNTYLNRPDVQFSRKQLSELIAGNP
jgi:tetratricopeptide (TPR) repeat protein/tRNA A-37 threonylcarbamoyl transferase component Bud32